MFSIICLQAFMQTRWLSWLWWLLALVMVCTGCSTTLPDLDVAPAPRPLGTPYTPALPCLGRLMDRYYGRNEVSLVIAFEPAKDGSRGPISGRDEIPHEITLMVATALNAVHPRLLVSKVLSDPGRPNLDGTVKPDIVVQVGITSYDQLIFGRGWKSDISLLLPKGPLEGPEVDFQKLWALSHLSLDIMMYDYPSGISTPFTQATMGIHLRRVSREANAAVAVSILGFGLGVVEKRVDSIGTAVRMLVELALIQSLSRRFRLPFQRCIDDKIEDPLLERRILGHFDAQSPRNQALLIRELLRGYDVPIAPSGPWDRTVENQLEVVKQQHALSWPPGDGAKTYLALYMSYPLSDTPQSASEAARNIYEKLGGQVAQVKAVQHMLQTLGYSVGRIDGIAGDKTRRAIRRFQAARGVPVTGRISSDLFVQLSIAAEL